MKRFYHSVLDPEAKVITEEDTEHPFDTKIHMRPDIWRAFVSNTWIKEPQFIEMDDGRKVGIRIDYNKFNYCSTCGIKYPKNILRCDGCHHKIRTKAPRNKKESTFTRL